MPDLPPDDEAPAEGGAAAPLRVLVRTGGARDVALVAEVAGGAGVRVEAADDADGLVGDDVGVVLVTEAALGRGGAAALGRALARQPPWSELPVLLFVGPGRRAADALRAAGRLGPRANVTVLERPVRRAALATAVGAALRARRTQLEVRDLLGRLTALNDGLQDRVDAQTAALRERADEVEALARDLTRAERRERERIAQLLHDDLQQLLYGLKIHLDPLASGAAPPTPPRLQKVAGWVDDAIEQTRLLTTDLHPPTLAGDGLGPALGWVADFARRRHGMTVHLDVTDEAVVPDPDLMALVTRAAKELLFNVVKHAGVREAWVSAWCDAEGCHVDVRDEGAGFPRDGATDGAGRGGTGRGLADLRDRVRLLGGRVEVSSGRGGSRVTVVLPAEAEGGADGAGLGGEGGAGRRP